MSYGLGNGGPLERLKTAELLMVSTITPGRHTLGAVTRGYTIS